MIGYLLIVLVVAVFLCFSILQIKQGKDDLKSSRRSRWINILRILFGSILFLWSIIVTIVLLIGILNL